MLGIQLADYNSGRGNEKEASKENLGSGGSHGGKTREHGEDWDKGSDYEGSAYSVSHLGEGNKENEGVIGESMHLEINGGRQGGEILRELDQNKGFSQLGGPYELFIKEKKTMEIEGELGLAGIRDLGAAEGLWHPELFED